VLSPIVAIPGKGKLIKLVYPAYYFMGKKVKEDAKLYHLA